MENVFAQLTADAPRRCSLRDVSRGPAAYRVLILDLHHGNDDTLTALHEMRAAANIVPVIVLAGRGAPATAPPAPTATRRRAALRRDSSPIRAALTNYPTGPGTSVALGTLCLVSNPSDVEARLAALEARVEVVAADAQVAAADAAAARHLAAARDLADLAVKVDANRAAINGLGVQTAARFDQLEQRLGRLEDKVDTGFAEVDRGFIEMRGRFDQTAAGMAQIVDLLTGREGQ